MIPIFHRKGLVIKHAVIDAQKVHAVWSYKEQIQIPSTGCSLKFEVFWILVFLNFRIFDTRSLNFPKNC